MRVRAGALKGLSDGLEGGWGVLGRAVVGLCGLC